VRTTPAVPAADVSDHTLLLTSRDILSRPASSLRGRGSLARIIEGARQSRADRGTPAPLLLALASATYQ
jgi:hypothetical protein